MNRTSSIKDARSRYPDKLAQPRANGLIHSLCEELSRRGVAYCCWKSSATIELSAAGEKDLDLLVNRADVQLFTEILYRLGFKQARDLPTRQMPGVLDYYGYDAACDKLIHVHAYYELIVGHDLTKNYHIPIERPYLEYAVQSDLFKMPAPEFELIIFVIRMMLKHFTWDAILGRQRRLSAAEREKMSYLQSRVSQQQMDKILKQQLPYLDARLFEACMESLKSNCPFWIRVRVSQQLQSRLKAHSRRSQISDVWLKLWRRMVSAVHWRIFGHSPKKIMASGGLMVAIIGGDGAGKTTAVGELHRWLSREFETLAVHMGKPTWSWTTITVRAILKIGRSLGFYPFMRAPIRYTLDTDSLFFPGYPWLFREVCTARDRYLTYVKARRLATNGRLVICDRFPLPQLKLMDGPQTGRMTSTYKTNRFIRFLIGLERRYYQSIVLPDLLIVLRADPDTTVRRKSDEDVASVRARTKEVWEIDWGKTSAHVINASRPETDVLSELKSLIWSHL
jgi:thymidylate kinase